MSAAQPIVELETLALSWPDQARALAVESDAAFAEAGEMLLGIKALRAKIASECDPVISAAHKAHKAACDQKNRADKPLVEAESILKRSMATYHDAQERARRAEAARLEAEAREREETARLAEAAAVEASGDREEAERILEEPPPVPAFVPPPLVARVQGVAMREEWSGEVTDLRALCAAIGAGSAPVSLVQINQPVLNGLARSLKRELAYPGVRAVVRTGVAAGLR